MSGGVVVFFYLGPWGKLFFPSLLDMVQRRGVKTSKKIKTSTYLPRGCWRKGDKELMVVGARYTVCYTCYIERQMRENIYLFVFFLFSVTIMNVDCWCKVTYCPCGMMMAYHSLLKH
ncbi:hypothetical protein B0H63DRAFT_283410 [Podospora didyma]|uniref:Uncharacterized protein n=1 Tax=Podospora didyma TaxID=330526 RepID=A0AAE0N749_9PEZI|nr:hypothetical protein B0H63DRAFT_283410 [Podospora didyma]